MAVEHVHCPVCGNLLARMCHPGQGRTSCPPPGSQRQGRGFEWSYEGLRLDVVIRLERALVAAMQQVQGLKAMLARSHWAPICTSCGGSAVWLPEPIPGLDAPSGSSGECEDSAI